MSRPNGVSVAVTSAPGFPLVFPRRVKRTGCAGLASRRVAGSDVITRRRAAAGTPLTPTYLPDSYVLVAVMKRFNKRLVHEGSWGTGERWDKGTAGNLIEYISVAPGNEGPFRSERMRSFYAAFFFSPLRGERLAGISYKHVSSWFASRAKGPRNRIEEDPARPEGRAKYITIARRFANTQFRFRRAARAPRVCIVQLRNDGGKHLKDTYLAERIRASVNGRLVAPEAAK